MVDIHADPLHEVRVVKRWAILAVLVSVSVLVPVYALSLGLSFLHLALLFGPTAFTAVASIELASRWEYRMRRRHAYPLRLGYELGTIHDFREACQRSADLLGGWLGARAVVVAWLDDGDQVLVPIAASGLPPAFAESAPKLSLGLRSLGEPFRQGRLFVKPSAHGDPWFAETFPQSSIVYVPLMARERPEGLVAIAAGSAPEARDQRLLAALSMVMGLALDNCRLYEAQRAHTHHLQQLNRMKSDFLSTISHELRTPLTAITMAAEMLREEEEDSDPNSPAVRLVRTIVKGASRLTGLVADLVNISREDEFQPRLELDPVPVGDIVASTVPIIQPLVAAKRQTLTVNVSDPDATVLADRLRFEQVLINLLSNAQRYTPEGGHIEVSTRTDGAETVISVADSGPGVPPQERELIFEPFFRGDRSGLGLGLAIAKSLVELHNGRIWVETNNGAGSVFSVALPSHRPSSPRPLTSGSASH